jgi:zinc protease
MGLRSRALAAVLMLGAAGLGASQLVFARSPAPQAQPATTAPEWRPETFQLANGMRIVVLPDHRAPVVTHMIWYPVGSADEAPGKSGIAHFLEHLMFKATDRIPAGEYSKIVARNGGQDNAGTSYDYTNYWFRIAKDRLPEMMQLEADRIAHLRLEESEVLSERDVIVEERRQNVDSEPGAILNEKVYAALYGQHHYAVPVIGHIEEMQRLSQADAQAWYHDHYGPENAILVIAGDITAAELRPLAERYYGPLQRRGDLNVRHWPEVQPLAASTRVTHADEKVRQPGWTRYWLGVATGDPDSEALQVGMEILGGGRTSRMNRELIESQGIAVGAYAFSSEQVARGTIGIGASPAPGTTLAQVEQASEAILNRFLAEGPTPEELARAKNSIAAAAIYARDSQQAMANWYGSQLVAGQSVDRIDQWDDRIRAVTAAQVRAAMNRYIAGKNHVDATLTGVGQ